MSEPNYKFITDLTSLAEPLTDGILSRVVHEDAAVKVVIFSFDAGQKLSEHSASAPAMVQILQGEAELTLGDDTHAAKAGSWVHMPPGLRHAVRAKTPMVMLLSMLRSAKTS